MNIKAAVLTDGPTGFMTSNRVTSKDFAQGKKIVFSANQDKYCIWLDLIGKQASEEPLRSKATALVMIIYLTSRF